MPRTRYEAAVGGLRVRQLPGAALRAALRDGYGWRDLRAEASRAHNNRTASYLIGTPMLADCLEEALSQFGKSLEDFEEHL